VSSALPALHPGDLVAVRLEPGPAWLDIVAEAWESGAAIFPLDHRLSADEAEALLERARPTALIDARARRRIAVAEREWPEAHGRGVGQRGSASGDDLGILIATSGTSGAPRLVELSRSAIEVAVVASASALGSGAGDTWLSALPLAHIGGLLVVLRGILGGGGVDIRSRFDPADFAAGPAVFTSIVPTMLARLVDAEVDLGRFRAILVGGGALDASLRARAVRAGAKIVHTYGLTESCGGVVYEGIALPGVHVRIAEGSEVQIAGPTCMRRYRSEPDLTRAAFTSDGWLRTSDAGELTDGRLHVFGRRDDAIVTGGEKVWPDEVERVLAAHPGVAAVAVAGRPDAEWGERVVAWIVPRDPSAPPSLEDLRAYVRARAAGFRAPREMVVVDELPATALGKARRGALPG
jgi:o-succinylbenzoate---CoA ligase